MSLPAVFRFAPTQDPSTPQMSRTLVVCLLILYLTVFSFMWHRLHYGVEISDEAYYVADAYTVNNGSLIYTDNWQISSAASLLYAPFVKLYTILADGTEGIILFMRQAFLIYKLLVAGTLILLMKRNHPLFLSMLFPLPYLAMSLFSIDNFSYNTLSFSLLLLSTVFLYSSVHKKEKHRKGFAVLSGMLMALTVFAHAMLLFIALFVLLLLMIFEVKTFRSLVLSGLFAGGGLVTGLIIMSYLSVISSGLGAVTEGIQHILLSPYWQVVKDGLDDNLNLLKGSLLLFMTFLLFALLLFAGLFFVSHVLRKRRTSMRKLYIAALFLAQFVFLIYCFCTYSFSASSSLALPLNISLTYAGILLLLLFAVGRKAYGTLIYLVLTPFLMTYLLYIPLNFSGIANRGYLLLPGVMISLLLMHDALASLFRPAGMPVAYSGNISACCCSLILCSALCAACLTGYYGYVYRDAPLQDLTFKMDAGVYKGLYTVEERGKALIFLEDEIRKVTDKRDAVLFMDQMPAAYMMTEARHCASTTWDLLSYAYAYNHKFVETYDATDDYLLQEYFNVTGQEPSKIIYIHDKERFEQTSLNDADYRFNRYLERHYTRTYANNAASFPLIVFERDTP